MILLVFFNEFTARSLDLSKILWPVFFCFLLFFPAPYETQWKMQGHPSCSPLGSWLRSSTHSLTGITVVVEGKEIEREYQTDSERLRAAV